MTIIKATSTRLSQESCIIINIFLYSIEAENPHAAITFGRTA